jgi:hypothetical protein
MVRVFLLFIPAFAKFALFLDFGDASIYELRELQFQQDALLYNLATRSLKKCQQ